MIRIAASASPGEIRVALLRGDRLDAYHMWRPGAPDGLGDVHIGRVEAVVPAMAGAFVTLSDATGFLPDSEGAAGRSVGEHLCVRITRTAQGGKGPRLGAASPPHPCDATLVSPPVRLVARGPDPLIRLALAHGEAAMEVDDAALFARLKPEFGARLHLVKSAFSDTLEAEMDALAGLAVTLPHGMGATITPTPALTAIDVDGGATTAEAGGKSRVQMAANLAALPELARQIRLRNLCGAILIDFAGLPVKARARLIGPLADAVREDPQKPRVLGLSHLGLAELLRPRATAPLHESLAGPHAVGLAALRVLARTPARRAILRAAPGVVAALHADKVALADLAHRCVHAPLLRSDPSLPAGVWVIEDAK